MSAKSPDELDRLIQSVSAAFASGHTLGDLVGYDAKDYEAVYALGHAYYRQARYRDAFRAFSFLVMHQPLERRFVTAHASCLQMLKRYDEAIAMYSLASVMDMNDPRPTFHTAECLIALGRLSDAVDALRMVLRQSAAPAFAALKARAQGLLDLCAESCRTDNGGAR